MDTDWFKDEDEYSDSVPSERSKVEETIQVNSKTGLKKVASKRYSYFGCSSILEKLSPGIKRIYENLEKTANEPQTMKNINYGRRKSNQEFNNKKCGLFLQTWLFKTSKASDNTKAFARTQHLNGISKFTSVTEKGPKGSKSKAPPKKII